LLKPLHGRFTVCLFEKRETEMTAIFAAVDFSTVATWVGTVGVALIGIAMAFKGIDLGKRGVKKA